ncbi:MAG: FAD-dependent oxidoreductase, partial [Actinomycetota bacterium]|nr:FAD-dependent oxidoreductase [Actinomycetota bacterium]
MRMVKGATDEIVIVGAGLGGLSAAMHLAGSGRSVTVLERALIPGGRAGRISTPTADGSYEFDTGPTVLTMPGLIADCFNALGEDMDTWLTLEPLDTLYRAFYPDGSVMDVYSDTDRMAQEITSVIGPAEAAGYRKYVEFVSALYRYEMS